MYDLIGGRSPQDPLHDAGVRRSNDDEVDVLFSGRRTYAVGCNSALYLDFRGDAQAVGKVLQVMPSVGLGAVFNLCEGSWVGHHRRWEVRRAGCRQRKEAFAPFLYCEKHILMLGAEKRQGLLEGR